LIGGFAEDQISLFRLAFLPAKPACRVGGFDYISTLLDAALFQQYDGPVFSQEKYQQS
jgi:hypothetical protein